MSDDSSKVRIARRLVAFDLLKVLGVYLVGQGSIYAFASLAKLLAGKKITVTDHPLLVSVIYIAASVMMLLVLILIMKRAKVNRAFLYLKRPQLKDAGYAVLGYGMYFLIILVVFALLKILAPSLNLDQVQELGIGNVSGAVLVPVFIALAIMPPIVEELLFRGFLYRRLRHHKLTATMSALVVSALFGLAHGQLNVTIDTFVLSMVMIYVMEIRGSLWVTIGMHMIKNTLAFLALFVFKTF